jgi:uncharacterized protein YdhG (YjbR/CyaY superfamily)
MTIQATKAQKPKDVDDYISRLPADVQAVFQKIRQTIRDAAPCATEIISYQMPAFKQHGILVYVGAFQKHIGMYPPISGDPSVEKAIAKYAGPKGNLQFALDRPMPFALIKRIVKLRVSQDIAKDLAKRKDRKKS